VPAETFIGLFRGGHLHLYRAACTDYRPSPKRRQFRHLRPAVTVMEAAAHFERSHAAVASLTG
jgi:hypothetical protein